MSTVNINHHYHFHRYLSKFFSITIKLLLLLALFLTILIFQQVFMWKHLNNEKKKEIFVKKTFTNAKYNTSKVEYESKLSNYINKSLHDDVDSTITIVTGYFDLGSFQKGDKDYYQPSLYKRWMRIFANILNPVVFYTDSQEFFDYFKLLRKYHKKTTEIVLIDRQSLWAFSIEKVVKYIFDQNGYPKHYPNTVLPAYSCAMHAKYELTRKTILANPFKSNYIAWLDLGLFRELVDNLTPIHSEKSKYFGLKLPQDFDQDSVGYTMVHSRNDLLTPTDIVYLNAVWVCGCFFMGKMDIMFKWAAEYIEGVNWLLRKKLMNTDQQVIYILANAQLITTKIQTYNNFREHKWFHLGYLCREKWLKDNNSNDS